VISVGGLATIRRLHLRDGLSSREVSRRTGLSRNTVRQWLRQKGATEPKYPKRETLGFVDAWAEYLGAALKADAHRAVRERRTAKMLFEQIRALGYEGRSSAIRVFASSIVSQPASGRVPLLNVTWARQRPRYLNGRGMRRVVAMGHLRLLEVGVAGRRHRGGLARELVHSSSPSWLR
jgi:transposase-like protein